MDSLRAAFAEQQRWMKAKKAATKTFSGLIIAGISATLTFWVSAGEKKFRVA